VFATVTKVSAAHDGVVDLHSMPAWHIGACVGIDAPASQKWGLTVFGPTDGIHAPFSLQNSSFTYKGVQP